MTSKVTENEVDYMVENAKDIQFHQFPGTTTIVCLLTLENGFSIVGEASCIHIEDFDIDDCEVSALNDAKRQIWKLEWYKREVG